MKNLIFILLIIISGCTRPPDLDAPCRDFGRLCPQQPINVNFEEK